MENKEFIILHEDGIIALENAINEKFREGYLPDGNIVVSSNGDRHNNSALFLQRMKKKEETYGKC